MVRQRLQHLRFATLTCLARFFSASLQADDEPIAAYSAAVVDGEFSGRATMAVDGGSRPKLDTVAVESERPHGVGLHAALSSVEPKRLRVLIPNFPGTSAQIIVKRGDESVADGTFQMQAVSPGRFPAPIAAVIPGSAANHTISTAIEDFATSLTLACRTVE